MPRLSRALLVALALPFAIGACKKKEPPAPAPTPEMPVDRPPTPPPAPAPDADSIARAEAERARLAVERARAALLETVYFDYNSDALRDDARVSLDSRIPVLNANPTLRIRVDGHCDERGTDEYNLALGRRRAMEVKRYLTDRGIDASRIETMSFGSERPAAMGASEDAYAQNRRGEFQITAGGAELRAP